ncbi:hypothetical protein TYRP_008654 [Tyrophagus putrescentiae]|nr:hypothetical protein TYRP_008654 [Tyrophagus putrescentiae]
MNSTLSFLLFLAVGLLLVSAFLPSADAQWGYGYRGYGGYGGWGRGYGWGYPRYGGWGWGRGYGHWGRGYGGWGRGWYG